MHDWRSFDTILLDMDGTILDLAYDNYFWRELVPRCLARNRGATPEEIVPDLFERFAGMQGRLEWYCLDYWSAELSLDLRALKDASSHRVRFLPGAREFLARLHASGTHVAVVTNAHGDALDMKKSVAGLGRYIDTFLSSHEFGVPKEEQGFWSSAQGRLGFDPQQTLFIDDSRSVLDAARAYGIRGLLAVNRPDSQRPARAVDGHASVEAIGHLD